MQRSAVPGLLESVLPLRIGLLVENRYLSQLQPRGMMDALRRRGHSVEPIDPEAAAYRVGDDTWLEGVDAIVSRGRSLALQVLVRWAEARGRLTINRRDAIAAVYNKAEMMLSLAFAGIPTPSTFLGTIHELKAKIPPSSYPIILKPVFGDNCRGLRIVESASELSRVEWHEPLAMAQTFLANDGFDLKLYGIGKDVWPVRKPSCLAGSTSAGLEAPAAEAAGPVPLTPAMKALALRCAEIFGLELYGVDCVETADGPVVIEVNDFPNYTGIPGIDGKLADYVIRRTLGRET